MTGAIIGDVVGSVYEFNNIRTKNFPLITKNSKFTDDTIMTIALMEWLLTDPKDSPVKYMQKWGRKYPSSYGGSFAVWLREKNPQPYYSFGNGSAMRISPVAYAAKNPADLIELTTRATVVSHDHPEGLKGAIVTAECIWLALQGKSKEVIKDHAISWYPEIDNFDYEDLRANYYFNETCQNTVPQAIYCFLISKDFEDCVRTSISIGGDSDTLAAISCSIAGAFYGVPLKIERMCMTKLTSEMKRIINEFRNKYGRQG